VSSLPFLLNTYVSILICCFLLTSANDSEINTLIAAQNGLEPPATSFLKYPELIQDQNMPVIEHLKDYSNIEYQGVKCQTRVA
jgi:hypothetical protein